MRRPQGENGVGSGLDAGSASARCTSSRLALRVLTRRSSGAGSPSAFAPAARTRRPALLQRPASQSGRLWRSLSGSAARSMRRDLVQPGCSLRRERAAQEGLAALPGQDGQPALQRAAAALRQVLEQQALAQHGVGRLGQRVALARPGARCLRKKAATRPSAGASNFSTERSSSVARSSRAWGASRDYPARMAAPCTTMTSCSDSSTGCSAWCALRGAATGACSSRLTPPSISTHDAALRSRPRRTSARQRVDHVLGGQHARGQRVFVVAGPHRHHALHDDGAVVELGRHEVHGGAGHLAAGGQRAPVRVQARGRPAAARGGC
jgi:hypothetical protein